MNYTNSRTTSSSTASSTSSQTMSSTHHDNNNKHQKQLQSYESPNDVNYFYGRINRAESCLIMMKRCNLINNSNDEHGSNNNNKNCNGMFLLRERLENIGEYTLTIFYENQFHHYRIVRCQEDGMVNISKGKKFIGPIELIKHHKEKADGLVTKLGEPCERNSNVKPIYYFSVNYNEFYTLVENKIKKIIGQQFNCDIQGILPNNVHLACEEARGRFRYKYEKLVLNELHLTQHWFKQNVDRHRAEEIFRQSAKTNSIADGTFMVRSDYSNSNSNDSSRAASTPFKISIWFNSEVKHYRIYYRDDRYALLDGKEFDSLIQLVDYYHRCSDGLVMKLIRPIIQQATVENSSTTSSTINSKGNSIIKPAKLTNNSNNTNNSSVSFKPITKQQQLKTQVEEIEDIDNIYDTNKAYNQIMTDEDIQLKQTLLNGNLILFLIINLIDLTIFW
jgi:hypothetical protein